MAAGRSHTARRTRSAVPRAAGIRRGSSVMSLAVLRVMRGDGAPLGRRCARHVQPPAARVCLDRLQCPAASSPIPDTRHSYACVWRPRTRLARRPHDRSADRSQGARIAEQRNAATYSTSRSHDGSNPGQRAGPAVGLMQQHQPIRSAIPRIAVAAVTSARANGISRALGYSPDPGCDRLPSVRIATTGGRAAAQQAAIRPPQPRLSSSGCGARIRQVPSPITSSSVPIGSLASAAAIRPADHAPAHGGSRRTRCFGQHLIRRGLPQIGRRGRGRCVLPGCRGGTPIVPASAAPTASHRGTPPRPRCCARPTRPPPRPGSALGHPPQCARPAAPKDDWSRLRSSRCRDAATGEDCRPARRPAVAPLLIEQPNPPAATAEPRQAPVEKSGSRR